LAFPQATGISLRQGPTIGSCGVSIEFTFAGAFKVDRRTEDTLVTLIWY